MKRPGTTDDDKPPGCAGSTSWSANRNCDAKRTPMGAYIDKEQHQRLAALAERNERSLSAEVRLALREHIEREAEATTYVA